MNDYHRNIEYYNEDSSIDSYINIVDEDTYLSKEYYFDVDTIYIDSNDNIINYPVCYDPVTGNLFEVDIVSNSFSKITFSCFDTELSTTKVNYNDDISSFNTFSSYVGYTISSNLLAITIVFILFSLVIYGLNKLYYRSSKRLIKKAAAIYLDKE